MWASGVGRLVAGVGGLGVGVGDGGADGERGGEVGDASRVVARQVVVVAAPHQALSPLLRVGGQPLNLRLVGDGLPVLESGVVGEGTVDVPFGIARLQGDHLSVLAEGVLLVASVLVGLCRRAV